MLSSATTSESLQNLDSDGAIIIVVTCSNHTKTEWNGKQIPSEPMEVWKDVFFLLLKRWFSGLYSAQGGAETNSEFTWALGVSEKLENLLKVFKIWEFGQ